MLQVLFAIISLELKCMLYLRRQGYLLSPRFCSEEHSATSTAVRTPAQHIRSAADSQGKHSFEVLSISGLQAHQERWVAENKVQTDLQTFQCVPSISSRAATALSSASLSSFPIEMHKGSVGMGGGWMYAASPPPRACCHCCWWLGWGWWQWLWPQGPQVDGSTALLKVTIKW